MVGLVERSAAPARLPVPMSTWPERLAYGLALLAGIAPLWASERLPLVDLPQHLYLISVFHRLGDPTTLYPDLFTLRGQLTPYVGYYYAVSLLGWLFPLALANRLCLSAYVLGMPLALGFLLRSLRRPRWPSLLALPFAYGDSFAWGFVNYCTALPLAFLCCGLFVRSLTEAGRRRDWAAALSACLVAVLFFHVQAFIFLTVALPMLLMTTRTPEDSAVPPGRAARRGRALFGGRGAALLGVVPGIVLFLVWSVRRVMEGPVLSVQHVVYRSFEQNLVNLFRVLANMLRDRSDRWALYAAVTVAAAGVVLGLTSRTRPVSDSEGWIERLRLPLLGLTAVALYFALPFDVPGYVYYLNPRFAHLAAPLLLASGPRLRRPERRLLLGGAVGCALVLGIVLTRGFSQFGREAAGLDRMEALSPPRARTMGLIYDTSSVVMTHPVYLHSAAEIAFVTGGLANFSFATAPHSPVRYRVSPPPTFPSEWRPDQFRWEQHGRAYDQFLLRGRDPSQVFGPLLQGTLTVAGKAGKFWLVQKRTLGSAVGPVVP